MRFERVYLLYIQGREREKRHCGGKSSCEKTGESIVTREIISSIEKERSRVSKRKRFFFPSRGREDVFEFQWFARPSPPAANNFQCAYAV